jgi:cation diffusion facilitator CzcD-associated flavoprotein CzcO
MLKRDAIIVGAGPAGLALGAAMKKRGLSFEILEKGPAVGMSWRNHYERLHLHTLKKHSGLPGLKMPDDYPRYPSRLQVVAYLENYAETFQLEPRFNEEVKNAERSADHGEWDVKTSAEKYRAPFFVVATGNAGKPNLPSWARVGTFAGELLHSTDYKNAAPFSKKKVMVVGFGNSAGEIALDLSEAGLKPLLSVRGPVNVVPREFLGSNFLEVAILMQNMKDSHADVISEIASRLSFGKLEKYGLKKLPYGGVIQARQHGQVPLADIGTMAAIRRGEIRVRPGVKAISGNDVEFEDGRVEEVDAIVLATGFQARLDRFLTKVAPGILDERGAPFKSGVAVAEPGLFFCGFYVSPRGMIREIGIEAEKIGDAIRRILLGSSWERPVAAPRA